MKQIALDHPPLLESSAKVKNPTYILIALCAGLLGPLGFAPFQLPGMTLLSLAFLYFVLLNVATKQGVYSGFVFGMGYFGFGVSWVFISIHDYGGLNYFFAGITTLAFIVYLSLFPAAIAYLFKRLESKHSVLINIMLFSSLWCLGEFIRSILFTGFPWLLVGTTQINTPLKYLFPILGIYGVSFIAVFACAVLTTAMREKSIKRYHYFITFTLIIILPAFLKNIHWTSVKKEPVSIGVIQGNLAMRDKWDETLFWNLLKYYEKTIDTLLDKQLIILPESAIPLPASYLEDYLFKMHNKVAAAGSSLILGILQSTAEDEAQYYNSVISLGQAKGEHIKQQLVPFGEYIPAPFIAINRWLNLPPANISPGKKAQSLIKIANHPIASLICYEIAYPRLLRQQMPAGEWIVSISDNGWFGRSLASYQQLQMAQVLSLLTGRFHIVVNNDGLSSVINSDGDIVDGLPPFSSGILQSEVFPAEGMTPWIRWYNYPSLFFCSISLVLILFLRIRQFLQQ